MQADDTDTDDTCVLFFQQSILEPQSFSKLRTVWIWHTVPLLKAFHVHEQSALLAKSLYALLTHSARRRLVAHNTIQLLGIVSSCGQEMSLSHVIIGFTLMQLGREPLGCSTAT